MASSDRDPSERLDRLAGLAEQALELVPAGAEAQVVAQWQWHALTRFAGSRIHQNLEQEGINVAIKVATGGRVAAAATSGTDRASLADAVERAIRAAAVRPVDPGWPGVAGPADPAAATAAAVTDPERWDDAVAAATPDQRAALVAAFLGNAAGAGAGAGEGIDGAGYCDTQALAQAVATTAGRRARGRATRATLDGIFLRPPEGGHTPAGSGHATSTRLADLDGDAVGRRAARLCRDSIGASDLPPAEYPVVLLPECVAEIAAFLADGSNAKAVQEGRSYVEAGRLTFDEAFSLVDDVHAPGAVGLGVDTDGEARQRVVLIGNGRGGDLLHDRRTAARHPGGAVSTGHAHQASDSWGPAPAALAVLASGGDGSGSAGEDGTGGSRAAASAEELIGRLERGLVVACFNYCRVLDPKTVEVTGLTRNGTFWVEGGEVVRPVTNLRFTQSFVEALGPGRLLGWAADDRLTDCEWGPGLVRAPTLQLGSWRFTGGAAG